MKKKQSVATLIISLVTVLAPASGYASMAVPASMPPAFSQSSSPLTIAIAPMTTKATQTPASTPPSTTAPAPTSSQPQSDSNSNSNPSTLPGPAELNPVPMDSGANQGASTAPAPGAKPETPAASGTAGSSANTAQSSNGTVSATIEYSDTGPQPGEISISEALDEALVKSPRAAAIRAQYPVAKAGLAAATIAPNPVMFRDVAPISEQTRRFGPSLTLEEPWKVYFRLVAAGKLYAQTKIDLMTQLWSLRADVRRAYTEFVVAQATQQTLVDLYELNRRLWTVSSKRFQAGDVPELDVLRAALAMSQSEVDLTAGKQRVERAKQQLNVIMGRSVQGLIAVPRLPAFTGPAPTPFQLHAIKAGILPDYQKEVPKLDELISIGLANRLEIQSLQQQIVVNKANYKNAVAAALPNPAFAMGQSVVNNPTAGPKIRANFFTMNLEMPVTNINQGDMAKFKATSKQLDYQLAGQKNQVVADVSSAYNNLLSARERIRVYQQHILRESEEVARLSRRSYEVGQSDINATLLAQQANVQIRSQYLDSVTSYQGAFTDLEQACGRPLGW